MRRAFRWVGRNRWALARTALNASALFCAVCAGVAIGVGVGMAIYRARRRQYREAAFESVSVILPFGVGRLGRGLLGQGGRRLSGAGRHLVKRGKGLRNRRMIARGRALRSLGARMIHHGDRWNPRVGRFYGGLDLGSSLWDLRNRR